MKHYGEKLKRVEGTTDWIQAHTNRRYKSERKCNEIPGILFFLKIGPNPCTHFLFERD